jgi:hypothetical protein
VTLPLSLVTTSPIEPIEQEFEKDVWDVRRIPGVKYSAHRSDNTLNFTQIPPAFRAEVKRYLRFRLIQRSFSECSSALRHIRTFLVFFVASHPTATNLQPLQRADIEAYLLHLQGAVGTTNRYGKLITRNYMSDAVARLQYFLEYLERTSSPGAPLLPVGRLLWLDDRGKRVHQRDREIKYIPEC